jgi:cellulose synthase/poly-beta-1,6-N-acetylglucosamine synthase-like glycosyltransferase
MFTNLFIITTIILLIPYCVLILLYRKWFLQLQPFQPSQQHQAKNYFSIIIPARNEEENIAKCLHTIVQQNYPTHLFQVIVIDDHSTDNTPYIINEFAKQYNNIQLIKLQDELQGKPLNAYKKKAIEIAINKAKGNWIVTTDADCLVQKNWLLLFDEYIKKTNSVLVAAPVVFTNNKTIIAQFQYIDFMALQAATAATVSVGLHSMCNGANLAYNKKVFFEVGGFKGIDNIASGDDMLLMNKIKLKYRQQIGYLFCQQSIVSTAPMPTLKSFINQRIRWASKVDKYDDKSLLPVLLMVYLFNVCLFFMFFIGFFYGKIMIAFLLLIATKTFVEWLYIKPASHFFGKINVVQFALLQPLHIAYMVVAGWLGKFGTYSWKERSTL